MAAKLAAATNRISRSIRRLKRDCRMAELPICLQSDMRTVAETTEAFHPLREGW